MFRLIVDVPCGEDEQDAQIVANNILSLMKEVLPSRMGTDHYKQLQYRLTNDSDRAARNYLNKDDQGHARTNKLKLFDNA